MSGHKETVPAEVAEALHSLEAYQRTGPIGGRTLQARWHYVDTWEEQAELDGTFTSAQLKAIAWFMDHPNADWDAVLGTEKKRG